MTLRPSPIRVGAPAIVFVLGGAWMALDSGDQRWTPIVGGLVVIMTVAFLIKMALLKIAVAEDNITVLAGKKSLRFGAGDSLLDQEFSLPLAPSSRWLHLSNRAGESCTVVLDFFSRSDRELVVSSAHRVRRMR